MTARLPGSPDVAAMTLRQRVVRAGGWSLVGFTLNQGIRFGTNLLMTRLLVPEMYGVMAIAQMVIMGLAFFSDMGLRLNVIQSRRGSDPVYLNTVWVTKILVGLLMAIGALGVAAGIAVADRFQLFPAESAYTAPELPYVLAVLGLGSIIAGFESTKAPEASRSLLLGRLIALQVAAQIAGLVAMLALVTVSRSVWVLVAGALIGSAATTVLSHAALPGTRNRFQWDRAAFKEVVGFGKWIFLSSAVGFLALTADKILLGAFVSATILGIYSIATLLVFAAEQVLQKLIGEVAYPALSEVARERRDDLKRTVYRFYVPLGALSYGTAVALAISGEAIVAFLYDDRYHDAGWMLQILAGILVAVPSRIHAQAFLALGISRWQSHLSMLRLTTVLVALPALFHLFGVVGAIWACALSHLCAVPLILWYARRVHLLDAGKELLPLAGTLVGALGGSALVAVLP